MKLENARFTGYWEKGGFTEKSIRISYYELPDKSPFSHVLIVGNMGREEQRLPQNYHADFLPQKAQIKNLWDNQTVHDLQTLTVRQGTFLLLGITP
ncbi:MAG: cyclomaltodextrinase C-terminal domain-containing protein [Victivallales bacterium]|nr:cyclomaltodextrinase C-terminal domain-containing protein [Victivallales bacterium]